PANHGGNSTLPTFRTKPREFDYPMPDTAKSSADALRLKFERKIILNKMQPACETLVSQAHG
ncbi:hypothetical protein, partial [Pseudomonas sp.]|uniref:hypothetical protein n=1 Tax=Pseudomonas sp. TaxID=306 RepID=UPI0028A5A60F